MSAPEGHMKELIWDDSQSPDEKFRLALIALQFIAQKQNGCITAIAVSPYMFDWLRTMPIREGWQMHAAPFGQGGQTWIEFNGIKFVRDGL